MKVTGTDTGTAEIKAVVPDIAQVAKHYLNYTNVPITPTTTARVQIKPELLAVPERLAMPERLAPSESVRESNIKLEVDADGDGIFELESRPGNFAETMIDTFSLWWREYREPFKMDSSRYPPFYRGAWASRIDEARSYLVNADKLRQAGVDTVMLGIDIVFDPDDGEPESLGDDIFIFYHADYFHLFGTLRTNQGGYFKATFCFDISRKRLDAIERYRSLLYIIPIFFFFSPSKSITFIALSFPAFTSSPTDTSGTIEIPALIATKLFTTSMELSSIPILRFTLARSHASSRILLDEQFRSNSIIEYVSRSFKNIFFRPERECSG